MSKVVTSIEFYDAVPDADGWEPDDDETPVSITFKHAFAERVYEELLDDYMSLTEDEFKQMRRAINKAYKAKYGTNDERTH